MLKLFLLIPVGFFWIQFLTFAVEPGNILGFVSRFSEWLEKRNPKIHAVISKPLWTCWICMSSVHGAIVFAIAAFLFPEYGFRWIELPLYCILLCGGIITYSEITGNA